MGDHIVDGEFQSDKYPTCPRGKVPLSVGDKTAQDLLWEYARRRRLVDEEFAEDLETCLRAKNFVPPPQTGLEHVRSFVREAVMDESPSYIGNETCLCIADRVLEKLAISMQSAALRVESRLSEAFMAGVEYGVGWLTEAPLLNEAPGAESEAALYAEAATAELGLLTPTAAKQELRVEERETLRTVRRLVAATAKCCVKQEEYAAQIALLDRLIEETR